MQQFDDQSEDLALVAAMALEEFKERAFLILVGRYKQKIYHHSRSMLGQHDDAHDATQNTFIKLWEKHQTFKGKSGFYTWLYRIASNEALNILRKRKRMPTLLPELEAEQIAHNINGADSKAIEQVLERALSRLPPKQRMVFCLRYFQEISYAELSAFLNTSESALKASYHFALKKIEKELRGYENI